MARLEVETAIVKVKGFYEKGKGEGRKFVSKPRIFRWLKEKLGFAPYPGTFNIRICPKYLRGLETIRKYLDGGMTILPPRGSAYCVGVCFKARFEGRENAAIVIPLVKDYYKDVIEILSPVELKKTFELKEGDLVSVEVEIPIKRLTGLKAVIFDLDGTIYDNIEPFYRSFNMALKDFGLKSVSLEWLRYNLSLGKNLMELLSEHLSYDLASKLYERVNAIYGEMAKRIVPFKGVKEALGLVKSRGLALGLATGGKVSHKELKDDLERNGLFEYFDGVVTGIEVERGKPFPDLVRKCAEKLGVKEKEFVYVGDAVVDVRSGKAAGGFTVSVLTGVGTFEDLIYESPDCIIKDVTELPERIEEG